MFCRKCGNKLNDNDFVCNKCKTPVSRRGVPSEPTIPIPEEEPKEKEVLPVV